MEKMFAYSTSIIDAEFANIYAPKLISMRDMFSYCSNLKNISFINFEAPKFKIY